MSNFKCPMAWLLLLLLMLPAACQAPDRLKTGDVSYRIVASSSSDEQLLSQNTEIRGGFFSIGDDKPLTVRYTHGHDDSVVTLQFLQNDRVLGEETNYRIRLGGVCKSRKNGRLLLLLRSWTGAATIAEETIALGYNPEEDRVESKTIYGPMDSDNYVWDETVICQEGEHVWGKHSNQDMEGNQNVTFTPCTCTFEKNEDTANLAHQLLRQLGGDLKKLEIEEFPAATSGVFPAQQFEQHGPTISNKQLQLLIHKVSALEPGSDLSAEKMESKQYELVAMRYESPLMWDAYQLILMRQKEQSRWRAIYKASVSSKAFNTANLIEFVGDESHIDLQMCVHDCSWWGGDRKVTLDLSTLKTLRDIE